MAKKTVDLGEIFSKAISCGFSFKRILPFFIISLVFIFMIFASAESFISLAKASENKDVQMSMMVSFVPSIFLMILVFVIAMFVYIYFICGLIDNAKKFWSKKEVSFMDSLKAAKPFYFSLLLATLLVGIISGFLGMIPFFGTLLTIILSWLFLVYQQSIIIGKKKVIASLEDSYNIFMENKFQTILFWIIIVIVSMVFFILAIAPFIISAMPAMIMMSSIGALAAFRANMLLLLIGAFCSGFLVSFVIVFSESAKTFYYMQVTKKK